MTNKPTPILADAEVQCAVRKLIVYVEWDKHLWQPNKGSNHIWNAVKAARDWLNQSTWTTRRRPQGRRLSYVTKQGSYQVTIKTDDVKELENKLFEVTADYDHDATFTALRNIMTFWMSTVCPNCRKHIAKELKAGVPKMLAEANYLAATNPPPTGSHSHTH